jgi:hypothetical protein
MSAHEGISPGLFSFSSFHCTLAPSIFLKLFMQAFVALLDRALITLGATMATAAAQKTISANMVGDLFGMWN